LWDRCRSNVHDISCKNLCNDSYLETYLEFPGAGDRRRAQNLEAHLKTWGETLFQTLFPTVGGMDHPLYARLMQQAEQGDRCPLTLDSQDPEVLVRPWEMAREQRGPLAFQGISLRRRPGPNDEKPSDSAARGPTYGAAVDRPGSADLQAGIFQLPRGKSVKVFANRDEKPLTADDTDGRRFLRQ